MTQIPIPMSTEHLSFCTENCKLVQNQDIKFQPPWYTEQHSQLIKEIHGSKTEAGMKVISRKLEETNQHRQAAIWKRARNEFENS